MNRIAKFEKVSFKQFANDCTDHAENSYSNVKIPVRATSGSAGYDFISPISFKLEKGETIVVPTGIRCRMDSSWLLMIAPKSGLGFKYRLQLDNTIGIIDSDYYNAENEGHILVKVTNDSKADKTLEISAGKAFAQGIFLPYGITEDDEADGNRSGGFGSTGV